MSSPMNFRFPVIDGVVESPTQSLIAEAAFWTVLMLLYSLVASKYARRWARKMGFWGYAKDRCGIFCGNGQDDNVLLFLWGIHHLTAGLMMLYGLCNPNSDMWRHGYLLECGYEIADTLSILIPLYPYKMDGVKPEMKPAAIFHHTVGTTLAYPILTTFLARNEHIQAIAMWLLLGAAVSCAASCFNYSLDLRRNKPLVTLSLIINYFFFLYCRFYQFPRHSFLLLKEVKTKPFVPEEYGNMDKGTVLSFLYMGLAFMTLFNLGIATDLTPKVVRYIKSTLDGGVTPLELGPVPRSRDSIFSHRASVVASPSLLSRVASSSGIAVTGGRQEHNGNCDIHQTQLNGSAQVEVCNGRDVGEDREEEDEGSMQETVKLLRLQQLKSKDE